MEPTSSSANFSNVSADNKVYLETISSSSDLSDPSANSSFLDGVVEQRRKEILYCFLCQKISNDFCWKDNHLVFDVSDIIHCAIGNHVILFYKTITNLDSALDQRRKYGEVLNTVEASLRRLTISVQEKIADNNQQISQLEATKDEIVSFRDNFLSAGRSSGTDREDFRSQIADCTKTLVDSCANAAQIYQFYSDLQQSYLKVIIDGPYGNLSSVRVESSIDGPINILHVLDQNHLEGHSTAEDVRRVVAYALETSHSISKKKNEARRIYPTRAMLRRSPFPSPRTLLGAPDSLLQANSTPSLRRPFDCRNKNSKLPSLSVRRLSSSDDESSYITLANNNILPPTTPASPSEPPKPPKPTKPTKPTKPQKPSSLGSLASANVKTQLSSSSSSDLSIDSFQSSVSPENSIVSLTDNALPPTPSLNFPAETRSGITGTVLESKVNKGIRSILGFDPDAPEFHEVAEGPNLSLRSPIAHSVNLEDAVVENRRYASDRIRSAFKNTCTWHPQTNWLATTSDGPDALIWILPAKNEIKDENKVPNESVRSAKFASLSDALRKQNRRVALDHSNDPVFQIAWDPSGTILVTGSKKGVIRFWSIEGKLNPESPPEAETMVETHENEVLVLKFSPSGKYLVSGGMDGKMLVWDMDRLSLRQTFTCHSDPICDVDWKINTNIFASCAYNGCIFIHRVGQDHPLRSLSDYPVWVKSVRWNPGSDVLATCSVDSSLQIWKDALKINSEPKELNGHYRSVNSISWRPFSSGASVSVIKMDSMCSKYLASGSDDGTVIMWHATLKTKMVLSSKNKSCVKCIAFSPNGKLLAAGRGDGHVDCWYAKKGKLIGSMKLSGEIYSIEWDATGTHLAAAVGNFGAEYFEIAELKLGL